MGARKQATATKPPANTTKGGRNPHPEGTEDKTPKRAQGDHPAKAGNTKPGAAAHRGKGHPKRADTRWDEITKVPATKPEREGMGGQVPQGPGQEQPATNTKKPKQETQKKTHPDNPTKKSGPQPGPGPSTHAHTAHPSQERR